MLRELPNMGIKQWFEHDAICETEEYEAAGADSTKGAEEAQRGMRGWRKGFRVYVLTLTRKSRVKGRC